MQEKMNKTEVLLLIFIILLGAFLRFYNIGGESFWLDEAATAHAIVSHTTSELLMLETTAGNLYPGYWENFSNDLPAYFVLVSLWSKFLGISEVALRSLSAIFGSLAVLAIYFVAKELANDKVGILSSLIFSISMVNIEYSQEARAYSLLVLISLSSAFFFIRMIRTGKIAHLIMFVVCSVIGLYTHFIYLFFIAFEVLYSLLALKANPGLLRKFIVSFAFIGLSFLPILSLMSARPPSADSWLNSVSLASVMKILAMLNIWIYPSAELISNIQSENFYSVPVTGWMLIASAALFAIMLALFFTLGLYRYLLKTNPFPKAASINKIFRNRSLIRSNWVLFLILWLFIPFLLELSISFLSPSMVVFGPIRYLIFIIPAYIILVSESILSLNWPYAKTAIILILALSILPLSSYYGNPNKAQWKDAAIFLKKNIADNEIILVNNPNNGLSLKYYYGKSDDILKAFNQTDASRLSKDKRGVWLVLSGDKFTDPGGSIQRHMETEFKLAMIQEFFDIKILHYSRT